MEIIYAFIIFAIGLVLIIKGGDWFVDAATQIAKAAHIPLFIIGATIVSFATTMPEMIVSLMASIGGKNEMAVGNAIGSVTANTGLIMAIGFLFLAIHAHRKTYMKQCILLILATVVLWIGSLNGNVELWASVLLILIFISFMILNVTNAKNTDNDDEIIYEKLTKIDIIKNVGLFIVGAIGIIIGSRLIINGGSTIISLFGVPERVIAITMVAIGTSLPELITTITAIRKKEASLSIGNIIGANIIDISLILPICSFVSSKSFVVSHQSLIFDFPICLLISLIALIPLIIKEKGYKIQGIIMLLVYVLYLIFTI